MKNADLVSGVVLAAFGILMLTILIPAQIDTAPDGYISPRLVPNIAVILITALSLLLAFKSLRPGAQAESRENVITRGELIALLKIAVVFAASLGAFLLGLPLVAGIILIAGTLLMLGERRPLLILLMTAGLLLAIWLLFYKFLGTAIV